MPLRNIVMAVKEKRVGKANVDVDARFIPHEPPSMKLFTLMK